MQTQKLRGWRRVVMSGYPLWTDVWSRAKGLAAISAYTTLVVGGALGVSAGILVFQYRKLPPSMLVSWPKILADVTLVYAAGEENWPAGISKDEVRTARQQGCPIDLHTALSRRDKVRDTEQVGEERLRELWERLGFLGSRGFPDRRVYGRRSSIEAVDLDIGECMLQGDEEMNVPRYDWNKARTALEMWGMVVINGGFDKEEIRNVRRNLNIPTFPDSANEVGKGVKDLDANIFHCRPQPNRLNLFIKGTEASKALYPVHAKLLPIVQTAVEHRWGLGSRVWLADARVVVLDNGGIAERGWSRSGSGPGYTAYIPLDQKQTTPKQETSEASGTALLRVLPGSHVLATGKDADTLQHFHHRFKVCGGVKAIDGVILVDNDLLVRGEENPAFSVRSYLKLTYRVRDPNRQVVEEDQSQPRFRQSIGRVFETLSYLYDTARRF